MVKIIAASTAVRKPPRSRKPSTNCAASQIIKPLSTNAKIPRVRKVNGKKTNPSTGRSTALSRPMTNAAISEELKFLTSMPKDKLYIIKRLTAVTNQTTIKPLI